MPAKHMYQIRKGQKSSPAADNKNKHLGLQLGSAARVFGNQAKYNSEFVKTLPNNRTYRLLGGELIRPVDILWVRQKKNGDIIIMTKRYGSRTLGENIHVTE